MKERVNFQIEDAAPGPGEWNRATILLDSELGTPELLESEIMEMHDYLAFKMLNEVKSIDTETQCGNLTRSVGNDSTVQITVFVFEKLGLITTKGNSNLQIQLLSSLDCAGFIFIRVSQGTHCLCDIGNCDC